MNDLKTLCAQVVSPHNCRLREALLDQDKRVTESSVSNSDQQMFLGSFQPAGKQKPSPVDCLLHPNSVVCHSMWATLSQLQPIPRE